jgi:phosphatidate cytidylyltransferase
MKINQYYKKLKFFYLILVLTISTFTDVFAYLVGSAFKGKKLCPALSPKKTISGAIGGLISGVLASILTYFVLLEFNVNVFGMANKLNVIIFLIVSGVFLSVIAQVGDLFESYLKRRLNIKDMGNIIPGHGGMLDRVDSLTFASLFTFIIYSLII